MRLWIFKELQDHECKFLPNREAQNWGKQGVGVPLACLLPVGLRRPGLQDLFWLIEARVLASRSEGLGWAGPVDKSEGFELPGSVPVDQSDVLGGRAGPGPANRSVVDLV